MKPTGIAEGEMRHATIAILVATAVFSGCSGSVSKAGAGDAGADSGAGGAGATGSPCVPNQEYVPTFAGFNAAESTVEAENPACGSGVCLVNHFQGSVNCPYGQSSGGMAPQGAKPCTVPGASTPVTGQVSPWCSSRTAAETVYCSCRCANADGKTNDGATYCDCPMGFSCTQFEPSIGGANSSSSGAYCIKLDTTYSPTQTCTECSPTKNPCP